MPRILQNVHLSDFQSKVLVIVSQSPTPQVAFEELSQQESNEQANIIGARDTLEKLQLITLSNNGIEVTEKGMEIMRDEYLIDEMGELTEKGQAMIGQSEQQPAEQPPAEGEPAPNAEQLPGEEEQQFPTEHSLFRHIHDMSKIIID